MPFDLSSAEDVKCLLQDAMPSNVVIPTTSKHTTAIATTSSGSSSVGRIDGAAAVVVTPVPPAAGSRAADQVGHRLTFCCRLD